MKNFKNFRTPWGRLDQLLTDAAADEPNPTQPDNRRGKPKDSGTQRHGSISCWRTISERTSTRIEVRNRPNKDTAG